MLTLSRPLRQALASLAVLVLMVVPSGYIAWNAWRVQQPEHRHEVERELSRQLGLDVALASVRYPQPRRAVFRKVRLRALEPARKDAAPFDLASMESLRVRHEGSQWTVEPEGLTLRAESPRQAVVQAAQFLQNMGASGIDQINLVAPACVVELGSGLDPLALHDLAATLRNSDDGAIITASYRIETDREREGPRCELKLARERREEAIRTSLVFRTMDALPLPGRVLDPFFRSSDWFGPNAKVEGELALRQTGAGDWDADFQGTILDLDLNTLITHVAPRHYLTGRGRLDIQRARWTDQPGRGAGWVEAQGQLSGGRGVIGIPLLQALQSQTRFRLGERLNLARPELEYQALGLAFELNRSGEIHFEGGLGPEYLPGSVLVQGQRYSPLVSVPEGTASVAGLIRALAPGGRTETAVQIPVQFESLMIQRYLPTPPRQAGLDRSLHAN